MAPLYDVIIMAHCGADASAAMTKVLKTTTAKLWERGAVVSDIKSWGTRELAYRSPTTTSEPLSPAYLILSLAPRL